MCYDCEYYDFNTIQKFLAVRLNIRFPNTDNKLQLFSYDYHTQELFLSTIFNDLCTDVCGEFPQIVIGAKSLSLSMYNKDYIEWYINVNTCRYLYIPLMANNASISHRVMNLMIIIDKITKFVWLFNPVKSDEYMKTGNINYKIGSVNNALGIYFKLFEESLQLKYIDLESFADHDLYNITQCANTWCLWMAKSLQERENMKLIVHDEVKCDNDYTSLLRILSTTSDDILILILNKFANTIGKIPLTNPPVFQHFQNTEKNKLQDNVKNKSIDKMLEDIIDFVKGKFSILCDKEQDLILKSIIDYIESQKLIKHPVINQTNNNPPTPVQTPNNLNIDTTKKIIDLVQSEFLSKKSF